MIATLLTLAALATSPVQLAEADRRNQAFVACLFQTARAAHERAVPPAAFAALLDGACLIEQRPLRRLLITVLTAKGDRSPAQTADDTIRNARAAVVRAYAF